MLRELEDEGVFHKFNEIYFITHSMGGLVTKRVLVNLNSPGRVGNLRRVKAVLYISTPAQGSDIADIGTWFSLNPQLRDMQSADINSYLQNLEDDWADLIRERRGERFPRSYCAYETKALYLKVIVNRIYATTSCDENPVAFDEDHLSIVKPVNKDAAVYRWARARIENATKEELQSNISQHTGVEEQLKRIEFLQQRGKPIRTAMFRVGLNESYSVEELGHFRILLEIIDLQSGPDHPTLWLAARDAFMQETIPFFNVRIASPGTRTIGWSRSPEDKLQDTMVGEPRLTEILAWATINNRGPFQTIGALEGKFLNVFISESLADKIVYFGFAVDDYLLAGFSDKCIDRVRSKPLVEWPSPLLEKEKTVGWIELLPKRYWPNDNSRPPLRPPFILDFGRYTPTKLGPDRKWSTVPDCDIKKLWPYQWP